MALDSDLGIDSIKRVEILSALQEKLPDVPAVRPEDLGVLQTLGQIIDHLSQGTRQRIPTVPPTPQLGQLGRDKVATTLLEVIAEKTGYPVEMLELDMALDSDLGIDSIKRVEILSALQERLPGAPAIKPEHLGTLQTVRQIVDFLASSSTSQPTTAVAQPTITSVPGTITRQLLKVTPLAQKRPTIDFQVSAGAEVWISDDGSALTDAVCDELTAKGLIPKKISLNDFEQIELTERLAGLVLLAPLKGTDDDFIKRAFQCVRHCVATLDKRARNQGAFLTTVSRLNGNFGIMANDQSKMDCLSGGLSGLCKTVALEWPSLHCKALDLGMGMEILPTAKAVANEIFMRTPLEVGITSRGLNALELEQNPLEDAALKPPVAEGELVIVSGGARGVTAEAAVALAERSQATLLLLGRSPLPDREPEWLANAATEAQIKQAIVQHADQALKPKEVENTYQRLCAQREIRSILERILRSGGQAIYHAVDLRDQQALTTLVDELRQQYGPVKGIIHGAGVLADKLLVEKTNEQFDQVYSTKVEGLKSLLGVVEKDLLSFIALFSSSTGRFGRIGQVDYAIANEILNKIAHQQAALRPECRVVSFNWGPWDGGMVTPALKTVFAREGIEVIDLHTGAEYFVDEISTPPSGPVEVVIMGGESCDNAVKEITPPQNIYVSKAFDLDLSVEQYPFLGSHVIDGKAVLPMAVVIEWLAHGAMHNNPGLKFQGFNDLRILKGVILEATESLELQVMTGKAIKSNGVHIIPVELSSGQASASPLVHARGRIVLASKLPEPKQPPKVLDLPEYPLAKEEAYKSNRLFHGEMLQGIREMIGCSAEGISALAQAAPQPGRWIQQPLRSSWLSDPLALDSSFQLLILWSFEHYQSGSLPVFTERYRQYQEKFPESGVEIRVQVVDKQEHRAVANIDFINPLDGQLVAQIENYECVIDRSLNQSFQRNKLTGVA
ncbi:MAG: SDR family NAD(P)-dependent oxidoreductase, partial [Desulfuromonadales bacterium]|nr:SDR family NAD(P)-dependent oxidoreductase [Desulfuromonadales bacterium]